MMPRWNPWALNSSMMGVPKLNTLKLIRWIGGGDKTGVPRVSPRSKKTTVMRLEGIGEYSEQLNRDTGCITHGRGHVSFQSFTHLGAINCRGRLLFPAVRLSL